MTVLTMRYSRKSSDGKDLYIGSTMILTSEVIKFFLCFLVLLLQKSGSIPQAANTFCNEVLKKPAETVKLSIPSTLYTIQNNLIILALSNLDAATFQVHTFCQRPPTYILLITILFQFSFSDYVSIENSHNCILFCTPVAKRNQIYAVAGISRLDVWCSFCSGI